MKSDYNSKILEVIKNKKLLDIDNLNYVIAKLNDNKSLNIDNIIKNAHIIDVEEYAKLKSDIIGVPYKNLIDEKIDEKVLELLPVNLSKNYKMIIFKKTGNVLDIGLVDPGDFSAVEAAEFLAHKNNYTTKYYLISENSFNHVLGKSEDIVREVGEVLDYAKENLGKSASDSDIEEVRANSNENFDEIIKSAPVSRIVSVVLKHAIDGRASDVHIEPVGKNSIIRFRIDGKLHNSIVLPLYIHNALIARVKVMSNMKIDETRVPQDGRIRIKIKGKRVDFRVSTLPLLEHEKVVMRVLDTPEKVPTLDKLGFGGPLKEGIEKELKKPNGMILITGPTGSGKSFTLFTFLNKINSESINISTLEDPVEYNIDGINQSQVRAEADFTFATGLRSLLRQDPDVIMVGEIRDNETAELAIHAALTGHLVFSTLHTNDAIGAIPRLIDMKVEPFLLSSTLNMILAQRLVRRICENCKEEFKPPIALKERIKKDIEKLPEECFYGDIKKGDEIKFYHGKGCSRCGGTGYKGRIAITETLIIDRKLKNIIAEGTNTEAIQVELDSRNYMNIMQDGLIKVLKGLTTLEEILTAVKQV